VTGRPGYRSNHKDIKLYGVEVDMRSLIAFVTASLLSLLSGCAGVGVFESDDPYVKLSDAWHLYEKQGRALIAERLIWEAMDIFQKRGDKQGLGHSNRAYAAFLRSRSIAQWEKAYREHGFRDKSITFENRDQKSLEYYQKALALYGEAEPELLEKHKYDALTNVYYNMAWVHCWLGQCSSSCAFFDKAQRAYEENIRRNPSAKPASPGFTSFRDLLSHGRAELGCSGAGQQ
jgi:tetratricopeptide (TPR) repeat protein